VNEIDLVGGCRTWRLQAAYLAVAGLGDTLCISIELRHERANEKKTSYKNELIFIHSEGTGTVESRTGAKVHTYGLAAEESFSTNARTDH